MLILFKMLNLIYNTIPLNKDICKLIFNYINYTAKTLNKLRKQNIKTLKTYELAVKKIYKEYSVFDLLLECMNLGVNGFVIFPTEKYIYTMYKKDLKLYKDIIKVESKKDKIYIELNIDSNSKKDSYINIVCLSSILATQN
jgi:hypothetical protein